MTKQQEIDSLRLFIKNMEGGYLSSILRDALPQIEKDIHSDIETDLPGHVRYLKILSADLEKDIEAARYTLKEQEKAISERKATLARLENTIIITKEKVRSVLSW